MPSFTKKGYPPTATNSFQQTEWASAVSFVNSWKNDPSHSAHVFTNPPYNDTLNTEANTVQWWNYTCMNANEAEVGERVPGAGIYPNGYIPIGNIAYAQNQYWTAPWSTGNYQVGSPVNKIPYELRFVISGFESIPPEASVKGMEVYIVYASSLDSCAGLFRSMGLPYRYYFTNRVNQGGPACAAVMTLEKTSGTTTYTTSQNIAWPPGQPAGDAYEGAVPEPDMRYIWVDATLGSPTSTWFTTGLTASDVRSGLVFKLRPGSPGGAGNYGGGTHYVYFDFIECTLYFQTPWYYGTCGVPKGFQKKMNGIDLATVAGACGMSREA